MESFRFLIFDVNIRLGYEIWVLMDLFVGLRLVLIRAFQGLKPWVVYMI